MANETFIRAYVVSGSLGRTACWRYISRQIAYTRSILAECLAAHAVQLDYVESEK